MVSVNENTKVILGTFFHRAAWERWAAAPTTSSYFLPNHHAIAVKVFLWPACNFFAVS